MFAIHPDFADGKKEDMSSCLSRWILILGMDVRNGLEFVFSVRFEYHAQVPLDATTVLRLGLTYTL